MGAGLGVRVGTGVEVGVGSGPEHASKATVKIDTTTRLNFDKEFSQG